MHRLVLLLLGLGLLCPALLAAQDELPKINGVVKNVDVKVGTITIRRKGAIEDETFNLLKRDINVTDPAGRKALLDAVRAGQTVQLRPGLTGDIEAIGIQASVFLATVADIDARNRTIAIADAAPPADAGQPNPFAKMAVTPAAKILLAGRPAYLREVKPGSQMKVTPSLDGKTALALDLVSDPDGKHAAKLFPRVKISRLPGARWVGVVSDVQPAKNVLHLTGPKTKGVPKSMPVAKDLVIKSLHGQVAVQDLSLDQLVSPAYATVLLSPENQQVTHIFVKAPVLPAKVKTLEGDGGQLTAEVDGNEKVFLLPRDVKVMDRSRVRRLGELGPDVAVTLVLSLDRRQLVGIEVDRIAKR